MKKQQNNLFEEELNSNSLIITSKKTDNVPLTKEQKQFNCLVKKIEKLTKSIEDKEKLFEETLSKYHATVIPTQKKIAQSLIEFSKKIDHFLEKFKYTKTQNRELSGMIINYLESAFAITEPDEELKKLYDKHTLSETYDEMEKNDTQSFLDDLIRTLENEFDVDLDPKKVPDPRTASQEEINEFIASLHQMINKEDNEDRQNTHTNNSNNRKKTKAQQQRELKEKAAEELKNKSLRSLYISLAKALHPDTGGTKEEILKKEELMKQVTQAYENKDLSTLLTLEITWLQVEAGHTNKIADKQLKIYNQVLNEQITELEQKEYMLYANPRFIDIASYLQTKPKDIPRLLKKELEDNKLKLTNINNDLDSIKNKKTLLEYLSYTKDIALHVSMQNISFDLIANLLNDEEGIDDLW